MTTSAHETRTVPPGLWRTVLAAVTPDEDAVGYEVTLTLLRALRDEIVASEPVCDHPVGICACGEREALDLTLLLIDGREPCHLCGGDGVRFDADLLREYQAERPGVDVGDGPGYVVCDRCGGRGNVPLAVGESA